MIKTTVISCVAITLLIPMNVFATGNTVNTQKYTGNSTAAPVFNYNTGFQELMRQFQGNLNNGLKDYTVILPSFGNTVKPPTGNTPSVKPPVGNLPNTKPPVSSPPNVQPPAQKPPVVDSSNNQGQVILLVNSERAKAGLPALKENKALGNVANIKAADMRDNKYFSHTSPTHGSPFDMMIKYGVKYKSAGENIAKGQKTPQAVMSGWMNSSGHRANILNSNFTEIGVGYVVDTDGTTYWVQMFIKP